MKKIDNDHVKKILNKEPSNENEKLFLQKLEYALTEKLEKNPIKGNFDLEHLSNIHKEIFKDFEWAGKVRNYDFSKVIVSPDGRKEEGFFLPVKEINHSFSKFVDYLKKDNYLKGFDEDFFKEKFTKYFS